MIDTLSELPLQTLLVILACIFAVFKGFGDGLKR